MMKKIKITFLSTFGAIILSSSSCEKTPQIPNEEELVTTVRLTLTPATGGGGAVLFSWEDLDGDGGTAPVIQANQLKANTVYNGSLELLNKSVSPAHDIAQEVKDEAAQHQFFYQKHLANLTVAYADQDANGKPLGLKTTITTGAPSNGHLTIILRHEPNKSATGVASGDITNAGGETDISTEFPVEVLP